MALAQRLMITPSQPISAASAVSSGVGPVSDSGSSLISSWPRTVMTKRVETWLHMASRRIPIAALLGSMLGANRSLSLMSFPP
jgi:hypothetical protein